MLFSNKRDSSNTLLEEWADQQASESYWGFINVLAKKKNTHKGDVTGSKVQNTFNVEAKHALPLINVEANIYTGGP